MHSTHIRICSAKHPSFYASIVSESPSLSQCLFWRVGSPLVLFPSPRGVLWQRRRDWNSSGCHSRCGWLIVLNLSSHCVVSDVSVGSSLSGPLGVGPRPGGGLEIPLCHECFLGPCIVDWFDRGLCSFLFELFLIQRFRPYL